MFNELEVVTVYNDERDFVNKVNGFCCNMGYKIISCEVTVVDDRNILYTAFLGKQN